MTLVYCVCKKYVNFEIWQLVLVENRRQFPSILLDRYNARIFHAMANTRRDFGSNSFGLVEDL
jgi:hypothetical protein